MALKLSVKSNENDPEDVEIEFYLVDNKSSISLMARNKKTNVKYTIGTINSNGELYLNHYIPMGFGLPTDNQGRIKTREGY